MSASDTKRAYHETALKVFVCIRPTSLRTRVGDAEWAVDDLLFVDEVPARFRNVQRRHRLNPDIRAVLQHYMPGLDPALYAVSLFDNQELLARLYAEGKNLA